MDKVQEFIDFISEISQPLYILEKGIALGSILTLGLQNSIVKDSSVWLAIALGGDSHSNTSIPRHCWSDTHKTKVVHHKPLANDWLLR